MKKIEPKSKKNSGTRSVKRKNHIQSSELAASGKRPEFEKFLAGLSVRLVGLPPESVDDEIQSALKKILDIYQIDRCNLILHVPGKAEMQVTHNADVSGISPYPIRTPRPTSLFPWFRKKIEEERQVVSFARLHHECQARQARGIQQNQRYNNCKMMRVI